MLQNVPTLGVFFCVRFAFRQSDVTLQNGNVEIKFEVRILVPLLAYPLHAWLFLELFLDTEDGVPMFLRNACRL